MMLLSEIMLILVVLLLMLMIIELVVFEIGRFVLIVVVIGFLIR